MKKILYVFIFSIFTILSFSAFSAQDDPFTALLKKLEEFTKKYPQEKVYLHLDKPYYAVGDDIWFKAYVVDTKNSLPTTISNILYVELIDQRDSITKQIKLPLQSGISWGDFKLSDTLKEGNYRIRAYTQWMRNAGPAFFFDKTIKIGNSWANDVFTKTSYQFITEGKNDKVTSTIQFNDKSGKPYVNKDITYEVQLTNKNVSRGRQTTNTNGEITIAFNNSSLAIKDGRILASLTLDKKKITKIIPIKTTANLTDVQFFPEGGTLVEGLPSKIGIKAINANGLGEDIKGSIIDNDGIELSKFETTHLGMGALFLSPEPGKTYTAKVKFADGVEKIIPLPKTEKSGYTLSINNVDTAKIDAKIMMSPDLLNKGELNLVAHHNGEVYFTSKIPTGKQIAFFTVAKEKFISGILQFTLFNANHIPVSERIVFINNSSDKISLNLQNLKPSYTQREKVALSFDAKNNTEPTQGSFSISVTNTAAITPDLENESNILTGLLLTADLSGHVEKPNHYFLADNIKTRTELDNLLLTQGWRKINWNSIIKDQLPAVIFQPEKAMKISGTITKNNKPVANGKITLFSSSDNFFALDTLSDANGKFNFDQLTFSDSTKFVVQARTSEDKKNIQIDLDSVPGQLVTKNINTGDIEVNVNESILSYLKQSNPYFDEQYKRGFLNRTILLKEVKVTGKAVPFENSKNLMGGGNADFIITAKDLEKAFTLSQYMSARIPGVIVRSQKAYSLRGPFPALMAIVVDGQFLDDFTLDDVVLSNIESVEVLKPIAKTTIYGPRGGAGIVLITTKKGPPAENSFNKYSPGVVSYSPKGLYVMREFYSPKYTAIPDPKPDLRTTVYWNPNLLSDNAGKASFDYFNTDKAGTYRIVIEGVDKSGNLARNVYTYQVQP